MVICLELGADLHMAQLIPLPLTVSCFTKIQIGFTFLVPAHPGSPQQRAVKRMCVFLYHATYAAKTTTTLHPLNGLFSRTTCVSRYQKGKTSLDLNEARDGGVWRWQWHQLDHIQTICTPLQTDNHTDTDYMDFTETRHSGSGISWAICKSAPRSRQITTPAPNHSVFYRPDALPAAQPTA